VSIWVHLLLSKFLYGQPTHRLLRDLSDHQLTLSAGTVTGGLRALAPLFEPLEEALLGQLRREKQWHADETRWRVFAETEGKVGQRWYFWVFHCPSVIHFVLDPSRSAAVPIRELSGSAGGIIICDRYSAYKKLARVLAHFILAFCWAHQRRDFLELANAHPDLSAWALAWVEQIGELYHLNGWRLEVRNDPAQWAERAQRAPVVARKNFYGSGSHWSGALAATMFSLLLTLRLWEINPRIWLTAYLEACAANGNQPPTDLSVFLPWAMATDRLARMRGIPVAQTPPIDSS
jgi:transposase